jgi:hypothetical protein
VAVVDDFETLIIDFNRDGTADMSHGEWVARELEYDSEGRIEVTRFHGDMVGGQISEAVQAFEKVLASKQGFDAVNFSVTVNQPVSWLEDGLKAARKRVNGPTRTLLKVIERVPYPVYTGAGNSGKRFFNSIGLAANVIPVGSLTLKNKPSVLSADNPTVKAWQSGESHYYPWREGFVSSFQRSRGRPAKYLKSEIKAPGSGPKATHYNIGSSSIATPRQILADLLPKKK